MKKNIFDTDIEMVDLDSIGDMELKFDELEAPNPELGNDVEMVMKETQVFSAEQVEKALLKNAEEFINEDDFDRTRVVNNPDMDATRVMETPAMTESEVFDMDATRVIETPDMQAINVSDIGETKVIDNPDLYETKVIGNIDAAIAQDVEEDLGKTRVVNSAEELINQSFSKNPMEYDYEYKTEDIINKFGNSSDYDSDEDDDYDSETDKHTKKSASFEKLEEDESYDFEDEEDDRIRQKQIRKKEEAKKKAQKAEAARKAKEEKEAKAEAARIAKEEKEAREEEEREARAEEARIAREEREEKILAAKEAREAKAEAARIAKEEREAKAEEARIAREEREEKILAAKEAREAKAEAAKEAKAEKEARAEAAREAKAEAARKAESESKTGKKSKSANASSDVDKKRHKSDALAVKESGKKENRKNIKPVEYEEETYSEDENIHDEEEFENESFVEREEKRKPKPKKKRGFGILEFLEIGIAVVLVVLLAVLGIKLYGNSVKKKNLDQFASVGVLFSDITKVGNDGIEAVGYKVYIDSITEPGEENPEENPENPEDEKEDTPSVSPVSVNFSSIEKDLKIKFLDKASGKLVTGVRFEVSAKGPKGDSFDWVDTDLDGIIYINSLAPGNYDVTVLSVGGYEFPETATKVKVQDTVVYQVINVIDEAVDMDDVPDLNNEENNDKDVDKGDVLKDTVKLVESTKTPIGGEDGFVKIEKSEIPDPKTLNSAMGPGIFVRVDDISMFIGEIKTVVTVPNGGSVVWSGGDANIVSCNSDGTIQGLAAGSTTVVSSVRDSEGNEVENNTWNITVVDPNPEIPDKKVESISILGDGEVEVGNTLALHAIVTPDDAKDKSVEWISDNPEIATIDQNGTVKGVAVGTAVIRAVAKDGSGIGAVVNITVKETNALGLSVKDSSGNPVPDKIEMIVGETYIIKAVAEGYKSDPGVSFSSSNNSVTVSSDGKITAVTVGAADVTVSTNEKDSSGNSIQKRISVTVKEIPEEEMSKPLTVKKDGKDVQVYYKNSSGSYVEAKWSDYYKYNEFYIPGDVQYKYTGWQTLDGNVYYFTEDGEKVTGEQVIGGTKYTFASDGSLIQDKGTRGIDVSTYNGTIDWTSVKNSGISFVIIRCGFRGYTKGGLIMDSKYKSYIQGATAAGLKVGLYFYSQATNEAEAVEEASLCVNLAQGYKISYPIFLDSEYANGSRSGRADKLDKATRTNVCKAFCETIKSAGYTPGIYASKSWFYDKLDAGQLSNYKIWLAHYCSQTDYTGKYDIWQHTEKGNVKGIKGNVDLDISYLGY